MPPMRGYLAVRRLAPDPAPPTRPKCCSPTSTRRPFLLPRHGPPTSWWSPGLRYGGCGRKLRVRRLPARHARRARRGSRALAAEVESGEARSDHSCSTRSLLAAGSGRCCSATSRHCCASKALIVDACRHVVRHDGHRGVARHASGAVRARTRARRSVACTTYRGTRWWPVHSDRRSQTNRIACVCVSKSDAFADVLRALADVRATKRGFALAPRRAREVSVLAPPVDERTRGSARLSRRRRVVVELCPGACAWHASQRTAQRALDALATSRQGAVVRTRAGSSLDDSVVDRIHDDVVTPGAAAD